VFEQSSPDPRLPPVRIDVEPAEIERRRAPLGRARYDEPDGRPVCRREIQEDGFVVDKRAERFGIVVFVEKALDNLGTDDRGVGRVLRPFCDPPHRIDVGRRRRANLDIHVSTCS
jgi:hypothetical protein